MRHDGLPCAHPREVTYASTTHTNELTRLGLRDRGLVVLPENHIDFKLDLLVARVRPGGDEEPLKYPFLSDWPRFHLATPFMSL